MFQHIFYNGHIVKVLFLFPRNLLTTFVKATQAFFLISFIEEGKFSFNIHFLIYCLTKMSSFNLACERWEHLLHKYWKQFPLAGSVLTNSFMMANFVWSGARISKTWRQNVLFSRFLLASVSFPVLTFCWPSHSHKKPGNLPYAPCWPRSVVNTFKSSHIFHLWSAYFIFVRTSFKFSLLSFRCTEWPTGTETNFLPLFSKTETAFRLCLELSMKTFYSSNI